MQSKILLTLATALLIFASGATQADDTDVYLNPGSSLPPGSEPMIMFSLDYRPNLNSTACNGDECATLIREGYMSPTGPYSFFDVIRGSLKKVFAPLKGVRVGLMLNHDNARNCVGFGRTGCSNGGYIAMGFENFYADDTINGAKARFHAILDAVPVPQGNVSHSYQGKELFFEFFRYLTGQGVYNGHNGWTDYGTKNGANLDADYPAISWDMNVETGGAGKRSYVSPLSRAGSCTRMYTVNTMFQTTNQEDDSDAAIEAPVSSGGFGSPQRQFPDVIQYLQDADLGNGNYGSVASIEGKQNVISYFIVDERFINTTTIGYARAGGTGSPLALSDNPDELVAALQDIFRQILSVSTTFVAASVPVNVFNRAEIVDNVYIALFQVDAQAKPSWVGNVKKLRLANAQSASTTATLVDARGLPAIAGDGRINHSALTFWTNADALPLPDLDADEVAGADGRSVNRGGAGQEIPGLISGSPGIVNGLGNRRIFYDATSSSLTPLNVDLATAAELQADFGAATVAESAELIAYSRGLDIDDIDRDTDVSESRPWIFGDPLHSRPLPLNYGAHGGYDTTNQAIYLAVGSNDGMLRLLRNTTTGGAESGKEVWAFMPRTSMGAQAALRENASARPHPYSVDGSPVAYYEDSNHNGTIEYGDKVYLYFGLRRGGKAYYALDVSNPEVPELLWSIEKGGDFAELGYTFSNPRVGMMNNGGTPRPILMFAGGYDKNKDLRSGVGTDDTEGNAIYVVDAETGGLIWKARRGSSGASSTVFEHADLVDSIPSTLTVADMDGDGYTDRIVVGDTGGNVWRADIGGTDTSRWKLSLLAALGRHESGISGKANDRRFFHRPDLVPSSDENGQFDAVVVGSGDRPDPLDAGGVVENYFYMIKDRNVAVGLGAVTGLDHSALADVTDNCLQVTGSGCAVDLINGWRLALEEEGEKVLATPLTIAGTVFFTSYIPQTDVGAGTCAPSEGSGRLWALNLQNAFSAINYNSADDDSDNPDAPTTTADRFTDLYSPGIPAEVVSIPPNKILRPDLQIDNVDTSIRWRTFWHLDESDSD